MEVMHHTLIGFLSLPLVCRQGGYFSANTGNVWQAFPISFNRVFSVVFSSYESGDSDTDYEMLIKNYNASGFTRFCYSDAKAGLWVSFGV